MPPPDYLVIGTASRVLLVPGTVGPLFPSVLLDLAIPPSIVLDGWVAARAFPPPPWNDALVGDILEKRVYFPALKPTEKFKASI